ncbi:NADH-quinone oxidoreductase subunit J family protein [Buchnera aphidicola]|uniref:NADH-quinone oxidoreductase subunit J family protein n=1 Tax=Buchnera aphidicola TaxID=9 RepID=UPI0031B6A41E
MELIIFYFFGIITIIATLLLIFQKNAMYALFYLIISILSIAGVFFSLGAYFSAALEIIIYAGAIMVLFIFVIMMLNHKSILNIRKKRNIVELIGLFFLFFSLLKIIFDLNDIFFEKKIYFEVISTRITGIKLYNLYGIIIELISFLLLAVLLTIFHFGKDHYRSKGYKKF